MDPAILGAYISTVGAVGGAIYVGRASMKANKDQESRKAEADAREFEAATFQRAKAYYDDVIERLTTDLNRVNAYVDRVNDYIERLRTQLEREQTVSDDLRSRLRDLEDQIQEMKIPIQSLAPIVEDLKREPPLSLPDPPSKPVLRTFRPHDNGSPEDY